jgi:tetratricopeptide (TPR) repeat protein
MAKAPKSNIQIPENYQAPRAEDCCLAFGASLEFEFWNFQHWRLELGFWNFHSAALPLCSSRKMRRNILICLLLAGITLGIYWPVRHFDLIYFDDPLVLQDCPEVQAGLTWVSIKWALTGVVLGNWHPVTNLSFLLVSQFFGTAPGPHHLANAIIHAANAVLLFLVMFRLTGAKWRSTAVAAIFAWHPLRVESVAWIIERKDVLCTFFFLLSLSAYTRFAQKRPQNGATGTRPGMVDFVLALLAFALALLSKPMAVSLPFVLLLLDIWPLNRITFAQSKVPRLSTTSQPSTISPQLSSLCFEKWPFFALTIVFCAITVWTQSHSAALSSLEKLGWETRIANAVSGYISYLGRLFWPVNLAAIYPYPKSFDFSQTVLKAALLLAVTIGSVLQLARRPWIAVGWLWFLGTALPVIGIVQVGEQSTADRYTYLPLIGPVVALVWTAADIFSQGRNGRAILAIGGLLIVCVLIILTERQLQFWRDTITLFEHNIAVTPGNASAHFTAGLGFQHAGDTNRAIVSYRVAKSLEPADKQNRQNLADLLEKQGHPAAAKNEYEELLALDPDNFSTHMSLANLFAQEGRLDDCLFQLNETIRLNPDCIEGLNNLAWELATDPRASARDGPRAVTLAQHACELTKYDKTVYIGTLAAAYAEAGRFDDAIATAQRACDLAATNGETALQQKNQALLEQYRKHQPLRQ